MSARRLGECMQMEDKEVVARGPVARLNPFAFPSDTELRFVLLVVAVLSTSMLVYSAIYDRLPSTAEYKRAEYARCVTEVDPFVSSGSFIDLVSRQLAFNQCTAMVDRGQADWMLAGAALVTAIGVGIYLTAPARLIRRRRLLPLPPELSFSVGACVAELSATAGVSPGPALVWDPLDAHPSGLAFGRFGMRYVYLSGGLVSWYTSDLPTFRAVVLHELGHLRNADVDRAYLTIAIWDAFVVGAVFPFILVETLFGPSASDMAATGLRLAALALFVYLARNAVLRARELYADVRASVWDGPGGALSRAIAAASTSPGAAWRRHWGFHPDAATRLRTLRDTASMFRFGIWDALATGVAAGIALPSLDAPLELLVPMPLALLRPFAAALVIAPLIVGVIGVGVWRGVFAKLARGVAWSGAARLGVAAGLGFSFGQNLALADIFFGSIPAQADQQLDGWELVMLEVVGAVVMCGVLTFFLRWVAAGASTWLEGAMGWRSPRAAYLIGLAICGAVLSAWLTLLLPVYLSLRWTAGWLQQSDVLASITSDVSASEVGTSAGLPSASDTNTILVAGFGVPVAIIVATIVAVWAYPLVPWLWRRRIASQPVADWVFLDGPHEALGLPRESQLHPGLAALIGAIGGGAFVALSAAAFRSFRVPPFNAGLVDLLAGPSSSTAEFQAHVAEALVRWMLVGQPVLAVIVQVLVVVVVSAVVKRLTRLHAVLAAFTAGYLILGGAVGLMIVFDAMPDDLPPNSWFLVVFSLIGGQALAALLLGLTVSAIGIGVRRLFGGWRAIQRAVVIVI
jgi:Zn-dependent protease with chaperone function